MTCTRIFLGILSVAVLATPARAAQAELRRVEHTRVLPDSDGRGRDRVPDGGSRRGGAG